MADNDTATHIALPELVRLQADARALRLPSARPARSRQTGLKQSRQRGRGMTFAEVRPYQPGDDIRSIDWRVTARRQAPHSKIHEEERERPVLLIADLGPTLFFASTGAYKQVRCAQITALLAWLALRADDQVGGLIFNEHQLRVIRPARRKKSVLRLLDTLAHQQRRPDSSRLPASPASQADRLDTALVEARRVAHTGSKIFLISDFIELTTNTPNLLGALARHNSVTALRILDPLEQQLPKHGQYAVAGPDGPLWFDAGNRSFRQAWRNKVAAHEHKLADCFRTAGVAHATALTSDAPTDVVHALLGPGGRL